MTKTKTPATPEDLRDQAARLRAEAARAEAELTRRDAERRDALWARQRAFDEALVASWDPKALDAEVERTTAELERAVRADPVVVALLDAHHAQVRRRWMATEVIAAHSRLGRDTAGAQLPDPAPTPTVAALVARTVERMSAERLDAERAALAARRNGDDA